MPDQPKRPDGARLLYDLQHSDALQHQPVAGGALDPQLALLHTWQSRRLTQTYAVVLADRHAGPACRFFLSDLDASRDFSPRDHDIERIYAFVSRVLPAPTIHLLSEVSELNHCSHRTPVHGRSARVRPPRRRPLHVMLAGYWAATDDRSA